MLLSQAPSYKDEDWLSSAFDLMEKMPRVSECCSVGIPTWFYGHEPATPFATHITKYFDNSIREDMLLAIAKGGSSIRRAVQAQCRRFSRMQHRITTAHSAMRVQWFFLTANIGARSFLSIRCCRDCTRVVGTRTYCSPWPTRRPKPSVR